MSGSFGASRVHTRVESPLGELTLVREGERIAEVLIPGVAVDVLAPAAGVLAERRVRAGGDLNAESILGEIDTDSE